MEILKVLISIKYEFSLCFQLKQRGDTYVNREKFLNHDGNSKQFRWIVDPSKLFGVSESTHSAWSGCPEILSSRISQL